MTRLSTCSLLEQFWAKVSITDGCWLWIGARAGDGYGLFTQSEMVGAHRLSYAMAYGDVPDGLSVCHRCDNPPCVRPSHLFLGTALENTADAVKKGRMATGERNAWFTQPEKMRRRKARRFLSPTEVADIRLRLQSGQSQQQIALAYDCTRSAISLIATGRRHAPHPSTAADAA